MRSQRTTAWGLDSETTENWQAAAQCRTDGGDPERFWPVVRYGPLVEEGIAACQGCPVAIECLNEGIELGEWDSIRGGLPGRERLKHHRAGLPPGHYPAHRVHAKPCAAKGCAGRMVIDPAKPRALLCMICSAKRRGYGKLPEFVAQYKPLVKLGLPRKEIARRLGYAHRSGLDFAVRRARVLGLLEAV